jgi:hypothetical protein
MTLEPVTALDVLQPTDAQLDDLVQPTKELSAARTLAGAVTDALWAVTLKEAGRAAAAFLDIDLGDVMVAGWARYDELKAAGQRTLGTLDEKTVELAGRDLLLRQHPEVELTWQENKIATIPFEVLVEIRVHAVVAVVRDGSLVRLDAGTCDVDVSLETSGGGVIGPRTRTLVPGLVVDLGGGFRLVD